MAEAAFLSDDPALGFDRFTVLNNPANLDNWRQMAQPSVHFGKFSLATHTAPYQLWEPDSQADIQQFQSLYLATTPPHPSGLHFAINIDPAMFAVFSANATESWTDAAAWNYRIGSDGSASPLRSTDSQINRFVLAPPQPTSFNAPGFLSALSVFVPARAAVAIVTECSPNATLYTPDNSFWCVLLGSPRNQTCEAPALLPRLAFSNPSLLVSKQDFGGPLAALMLDHSTDDSVHLVLVNAPGQVLRVTVYSPVLDLSGGSTLEGGAIDAPRVDTSYGPRAVARGRGARVRGAVLVGGDSVSRGSEQRLVVAYTGDAACESSGGVVLGISPLQSSSAGHSTDGPSEPVCVSAGPVSDASLTVACRRTPTNSTLIAVVAFTLNSSSGVVYASSAALGPCDASGLLDPGSVLPPPTPSVPIPIAIGHSVRLASTFPCAACVAQDDVVAMVVLDGRCDNSHTRNTRAAPRVCDAPAGGEFDAFALDYTVGGVGDWLRHLGEAAGRGLEQGRVSACHERLLHGTLTLGAGALDVAVFGLEGRVGVGVLHGGYASAAESPCGTPVAFDGLMLDGFTLPRFGMFDSVGSAESP